MNAPQPDWLTVRGLLWDDDEFVLFADTVRTTDLTREASDFSVQPDWQYCCANGFKPESRHQKRNIKRRHSWVVEFDDMPLDEQRKLLVDSGLPHTLRVYSANKSVHAFIRAEEDVSQAEWEEIAEGLKQAFPDADKGVLADVVKFCRTPNGTRKDNGKRQAIEFVGQRIPVKSLKQWLRGRGVTETAETIEATSLPSPPLSVVSVTSMTPAQVIEKTLPTARGQRNARILNLARGLKFNAGLADRSFSELRPIVRKWLTLGLERGVIGTRDFDETWGDFVYAWNHARAPLGDVIDGAWVRVTSEPLPEEALRYDTKPVRLLVALCKVLGGLSGDGKFFLSSHDAGRLLRQYPQQVRRKLAMIEADRLIKTLRKGIPRVIATRFRWTGDVVDTRENRQ